MGRKSKKKLFAYLAQFFKDPTIEQLQLRHPRISDETYGRDSRIYVRCDNLSQRRWLQQALEQEGGWHVGRDYSPNSPVADVGVSYFRGWHWDE